MLKAALLLAVSFGPASRAPPARPAPPQREAPRPQPTYRPPSRRNSPPERRLAHAQHHGPDRQEPSRGGHSPLWTAGAGLLGYWLGQRQSQPAPVPEYPYRPDVPEPAPNSQPALPTQPMAQTPYAPTFANSPFDRDAWCRNMPFEVCPPWLNQEQI